jgi:drug/metabolite transporter (DMT)-like permease
MPSAAVLGSALFSGLLASALAYFLQAFAQRRLTTSQAAVIFTLEPLFAVLAGIAFANETASLQTLAGGAVIIGATLLCTHPYFVSRAEWRVEVPCGSTEPHH